MGLTIGSRGLAFGKDKKGFALNKSLVRVFKISVLSVVTLGTAFAVGIGAAAAIATLTV